MSKPFQCGLIVGKFSPLHRGHELVIRRAFEECNEVVIIHYSNPEFPGCEADRRRAWLSELFPAARIVTPTHVPPNDVDETIHRQFCASLCTDLGIRVDAVFTSEDYGEGFAAELTRWFQARDPNAAVVRSVLVDRPRRIVPVSGTLLRQNVHANRQWLSPAVYASFVQRVCLLGGESSGKSSLAEMAARRFQTEFVPEYGRELWEARGGNLAFDDLLHIAKRQIAMEEQAARRANRYLICDTSPLTTLFYSLHLFGKAAPELEELAQRRYDATFLCAPDFPFVQDGTRKDDRFRMQQHEWYGQQLKTRGISFAVVTGALTERMVAIEQSLMAT